MSQRYPELKHCLPTQYFDPFSRQCKLLPRIIRRDVAGLAKVIHEKIADDINKFKTQLNGLDLSHGGWLNNYKKQQVDPNAIAKEDKDKICGSINLAEKSTTSSPTTSVPTTTATDKPKNK